jgi:hypothetical protein
MTNEEMSDEMWEQRLEMHELERKKKTNDIVTGLIDSEEFKALVRLLVMQVLKEVLDETK